MKFSGRDSGSALGGARCDITSHTVFGTRVGTITRDYHGNISDCFSLGSFLLIAMTIGLLIDDKIRFQGTEIDMDRSKGRPARNFIFYIS